MRVKPIGKPAYLLTAALGALLFGCPTSASADPIVAAAIPIVSSGGSAGIWNSVYFTLDMSPTATVRIFDSVALTPADAGTTITATANNEDDFAEVALQMTNGRGNWTEYMFGPLPGSGGGAGAKSEGVIFNLATPDFKGWTISAISLRIDQLMISHPADMPNWTNMSLRGTLSVLGTGSFDPAPVPEPGTMLLLATGALGLVRARRRVRL
jgi:hypothetical protein